jgi:hypothetical protein
MKKQRLTNRAIPWLKILKLYKAGKAVTEISDTLHLTERKKKVKFPYGRAYSYVKALRRGVKIDGKIIKLAPFKTEKAATKAKLKTKAVKKAKSQKPSIVRRPKTAPVVETPTETAA